MATHRTTFTLDEEANNFLIMQAGENKSAYINALLKQEKKRVLQEAIIRANKEEASDINYQNELKEWDITLKDGCI